MTDSPDPLEGYRRRLVGDVHARARSAFPSPILSSAARLASVPQVVALPRAADFMTTSALTPAWRSFATTALQAELDRTRQVLRPSVLAAMGATQVRPVAWAFPELAGGPSSMALEAIRAQSALATRPLFAELCRVGTGLSATRTATLTRELADLVETAGTALDDQDADEVVALLERDDADEQLVALDAMHDTVLDVINSEPVAELLDLVDLDRLVDASPEDRVALEEQTTSSLARLRARMAPVPKGHVAALVLSATTLAGELILDPPDAINVEAISPYLGLPVGILAVHGSVAVLLEAIRRRQAQGTDPDES